MTRCEQVRTELGAFIAGEPAEDGWDEVRTHIGACAPCADHCASLRRVWGAVGEVKFEEVPRGTFDRLEEAIRAASRERRTATSSGWLLGLADGVLAMIALFVVSRVVPVAWFCSLCRNLLRDTPFQGWIYTGEFTAGGVLSAASVLAALALGRVAWRQESSGRLAAAGFSYALLAILVGPHHVVVGNTMAFTAWGFGVALGTIGVVLAAASTSGRAISAPSA